MATTLNDKVAIVISVMLMEIIVIPCEQCLPYVSSCICQGVLYDGRKNQHYYECREKFLVDVSQRYIIIAVHIFPVR